MDAVSREGDNKSFIYLVVVRTIEENQGVLQIEEHHKMKQMACEGGRESCLNSPDGLLQH